MHVLKAVLPLTFYLLAVPITAHAKELCTVVIDAAEGAVLHEEGADCDTRVTPASTTKIALAVMGFDSGFLKTPGSPVIEYQEGYVDWLGDLWRRPTNPKRWLKYSVVWYSQLLAHHLGQERLEQYASDFGFGNADFSGDPGKMNGLSRSWISSSLEISPREQTAFLEKLVNRKLAVKPSVYDNVFASMEKFAAEDGWTITGKTGAARPRKANGETDSERGYGWFVGWAKKDDQTVIFARLNQASPDTPSTEPNVPISHRARNALISELPQIIAAATD